MAKVARFTVSLESELLDELDRFLAEKGYTNRSQGIRNIVRSRFVQEQWERGDHPTVATVNLVYDHHQRDVLDRLANIQHDHLAEIVSATHVHLDHDHCLEVLILRGRAGALRELGDRLIATRGILHGTMSFGTTGVELSARRASRAEPAPPPATRRLPLHGPGPRERPEPRRDDRAGGARPRARSGRGSGRARD